MKKTSNLFVYGTLTFDRVLLALLGYIPEKEKIEVKGYYARTIHLDGWEPFPVLFKDKESVVKGYVLKNLTPRDLEKLDAYEFVDRVYYIRVPLIENDKWCVQYYEPADNLLSIGELGERWHLEDLDSALEDIYATKVVPDFIAATPEIFEK